MNTETAGTLSRWLGRSQTSDAHRPAELMIYEALMVHNGVGRYIVHRSNTSHTAHLNVVAKSISYFAMFVTVPLQSTGLRRGS